MHKTDCIFCEISNRRARANIVFENKDFIAFDNIKPHSPVHILVIPKVHVEKSNLIENLDLEFWAGMMSAAGEVIKLVNLDKSGYRIVNNGAGYHIIDHEHIHILGGKDWKPKDDL